MVVTRDAVCEHVAKDITRMWNVRLTQSEVARTDNLRVTRAFSLVWDLRF